MSTRTGNMGRITLHPLLQPSGRLVTKFGSRGSELDQLAGPHYAATNSLGNIIVSDFHNHNIKVATATTTTDELSHSHVRCSQRKVTSYSASDLTVSRMTA